MNWGYLLRGLIAGAGVTAYILSKKTRKGEAYEQVAQPPFAPSRTLVFEREAAPDTA